MAYKINRTNSDRKTANQKPAIRPLVPNPGTREGFVDRLDRVIAESFNQCGPDTAKPSGNPQLAAVLAKTKVDLDEGWDEDDNSATFMGGVTIWLTPELSAFIKRHVQAHNDLPEEVYEVAIDHLGPIINDSDSPHRKQSTDWNFDFGDNGQYAAGKPVKEYLTVNPNLVIYKSRPTKYSGLRHDRGHDEF
jgi:hypothetical protein